MLSNACRARDTVCLVLHTQSHSAVTRCALSCSHMREQSHAQPPSGRGDPKAPAHAPHLLHDAIQEVRDFGGGAEGEPASKSASKGPGRAPQALIKARRMQRKQHPALAPNTPAPMQHTCRHRLLLRLPVTSWPLCAAGPQQRSAFWHQTAAARHFCVPPASVLSCACGRCGRARRQSRGSAAMVGA